MKMKISVSDYIGSHFIDLYSIEPLVGVLLSKFKIVENASVGTMGVDHNTLYYNKEFVKNLSSSELLFVLYHELMHVALMHMDTNLRCNLNPKLWNIACDLYVNKYIVDSYFNGDLRDTSIEIRNLIDSDKKLELKPMYRDGKFIGCFENWVDTSEDNIFTIYKKINEENGSSLLNDLVIEHDKEMGTNLSGSGKTMEEIFDTIERELGIGSTFKEQIKGDSSKGDSYKGGNSKGNNSKCGNSKGDNSKGNNSKGNNSKGDNSKGDSSKGDNSKGDSSKGNNSKGDNSKGGNSKGGNSKGDNSKGDNSKGG